MEASKIQVTTHHLDSEAEASLRAALGKLNIGFYFPEAWIRVDREGVDVGSVSIPIGKKSFLVITCEWGDTAEDFIDIYYFNVSIEDRPRDITVTHDGDSPSGWAFDHVSTINTWDWTIIEKISIYELKTVETHETVSYDRAILFKYEKGEILLSAGDTGPGRFEVHYKSGVIADILDSLSLRKEITDEAALKHAFAERATLESA